MAAALRLLTPAAWLFVASRRLFATSLRSLRLFVLRTAFTAVRQTALAAEGTLKTAVP
ncbi:hypothetical protein [Idiomarina sp.]|uniref:hypothetical protein n=1 Tax=Idiomarina sp. TaxID=1874361 RepID=UPI0025C593A1|nr:hypothetical protein [Idiomarina sp.]